MRECWYFKLEMDFHIAKLNISERNTTRTFYRTEIGQQSTDSIKNSMKCLEEQHKGHKAQNHRRRR